MAAPVKTTLRTRPLPRTAWPKGVSGNPAGKPRGCKDWRTAEVGELARRLVLDEVYQRNVLARLRDGTAGHLEPLLWAYAFGKPHERVDLHVERDDAGDWTQALTAKLHAIAAHHDDAEPPTTTPGGRLAH